MVKSDCMAKRVSADGWMFTVTLMLVFVGLVMVFSASAVMAKERYGSGYTFLIKQLMWAVAGIVVMVVAMRLDYRRYKPPAVVFSVLGITTLLLISVFFLDRAHNTHRWIHWGRFSLQPSELAKPALILFLAYFLENRTRSMDDWRNTLLPALLDRSFSRLDRLAAGPGYGDCMRSDHRMCSVCGWPAGEVPGLRAACLIVAVVFFDLPCRLSSSTNSGLS